MGAVMDVEPKIAEHREDIAARLRVLDNQDGTVHLGEEPVADAV